MTTSGFDCITCGACCFGTHPRYIEVLREDAGRPIPEAVTTRFDDRRFMTMSCGHCAQLTRTENSELVCAIYDIRPEACRAFRAGSFECTKARQHRLHLAEAMRLPVAVPAEIPDGLYEPMVAITPSTPEVEPWMVTAGATKTRLDA